MHFLREATIRSFPSIGMSGRKVAFGVSRPLFDTNIEYIVSFITMKQIRNYQLKSFTRFTTGELAA